jgi:hypothetical protein
MGTPATVERADEHEEAEQSMMTLEDLRRLLLALEVRVHQLETTARYYAQHQERVFKAAE